MSAHRILGLSLLLGLTACAQQSATTAPKPANGPNGSIHVSYTGGLLNRTVNAWFQVDQSAFVIVGHLGGDGVIRVIYPETPSYGAVYTKKRIQTGTFAAEYDGAPHLYAFTLASFRGMGAMMDSYDGRGHGYVFMIATKSPMYFNRIMDGSEWNEIAVENYYGTSDPRLAIHDYAKLLTGGKAYTLKFASSFTTQSFTSYADRAADCQALAAFGLAHAAGYWGTWRVPSLEFFGHSTGRHSSYSACGPRHYASRYYYSSRYYSSGYYEPRGYAPLPNPPNYPPPPAPVVPTLQRPGFRPADRPARAVDFGRSVLDRPTTANRATSQRGRDLDRRRGVSPSDERVSRPSEESIARRDERSSRPGRVTDEPRMTRPTETHTVDRQKTPSPPASSDAPKAPSSTAPTKPVEKP